MIEQETLSQQVIEVCKQRGWSLNWDSRLAYHQLEASEFIEAARGKHGDKVKEAGDVIITTMALLESNGVSWEAAMQSAERTVAELRVKPRYAGEEPTPAPAPIAAGERIFVKGRECHFDYCHIPDDFWTISAAAIEGGDLKRYLGADGRWIVNWLFAISFPTESAARDFARGVGKLNEGKTCHTKSVR